MSLPKQLFVLGGGGHGRVVCDLAESAGWKVVGMIDHGLPTGSRSGNWTVLAEDEFLSFEGDKVLIVAIGNNVIRERLTFKYTGLGASLPTLISPRSAVSTYAKTDAGCTILPGACVNAFASLGTGVIVNTGATVDHDCQVADFAHIGPGAHLAGHVTVGERSLIGMGANVLVGVSVGKDATVGAGSVVLTDVPDGATVAGVPARIVSTAD